MKEYISIPKVARSDVYVYAFDKKDGNQIRAEWSSKNGFYKFGTKSILINDKTPIYGESISLIKNKYESDLSKVFKEQRWQNVVCFFEFYGENSFSGVHQDEQHTVLLFDVNVYKIGLIEPSRFIKLFKHLDIPQVVFEGHVNDTFIENVRASNIDGITFEGVVCKGAIDKKTKLPVMFKIKTRAWLDKLKIFCKDEEEFNLLE